MDVMTQMVFLGLALGAAFCIFTAWWFYPVLSAHIINKAKNEQWSADCRHVKAYHCPPPRPPDRLEPR